MESYRNTVFSAIDFASNTAGIIDFAGRIGQDLPDASAFVSTASNVWLPAVAATRQQLDASSNAMYTPLHNVLNAYSNVEVQFWPLYDYMSSNVNADMNVMASVVDMINSLSCDDYVRSSNAVATFASTVAVQSNAIRIASWLESNTPYARSVMSNATALALLTSVTDDAMAALATTVSLSNDTFSFSNQKQPEWDWLTYPDFVNDGVVSYQGSMTMGSNAGESNVPVVVWGSNAQGVSLISEFDVLIMSDMKLKSDLRPIDNAMQRLRHMHGYTYSFGDTGQHFAGLLAQEAMLGLPELVYESAHQGIAYAKVVALLVEAVKDIDARMKNL